MRLYALFIIALCLTGACKRSEDSPSPSENSEQSSVQDKVRRKTPEEWTLLLGDDEQHEAAKEKLIELDEEAVPALIEGLSDKSTMVRCWSAIILGKIGPKAKKSIPALIKTLKDPNSSARSNSAQAIGRIDPKAESAIPALIECLKDADDYLREELSKTLLLFDEKPVPGLVKLLKGSDKTQVINAIKTLGELGWRSSEAVPLLIKNLKRESVDYRNAAARALGQIGPGAASAIPHLTAAFEQPHQADFEIVARALAGIGEKAVPALVEGLDSQDMFVQKFSAAALSVMGPKAKTAIPALVKILKNGKVKSYVQDAVCIALSKIGVDAVVPVMSALVNERAITRRRAAGVLGDIGPKARRASFALKRALKDKDSGVRFAAKRALEQINGQP